MRINREAQDNIPKERLSSSGDLTLFGTGPSSAGDLGVEGKHQHHDHGLAHGVGILPIARGVLHLQLQPCFEMIRRSRECVINLPTTDLVNEVIGIGNCSGAEVDKFEAFGSRPPLPQM